jgi:KaiC/GvpD/RAD55 family RecA-like ATPase
MTQELIKSKGDIKRIKTHVKGFDENMEGGIPERHQVLVSGTAGAMKSSFAMNVLYNNAIEGKNGLYISLEQSTTSLLNHLINMGFDFSKINLIMLSDISRVSSVVAQIKKSKVGTVIMTDIGAIRKQVKGMKVAANQDWLNAIENIIKKVKEKAGCDIFCLDSLSALYVLSHFEHPRTRLFYIFEFLRDMDITSMLLSERPEGGTGSYSEYGVEEYLADGIILLEMTKRQRKVMREISVVKMRESKCSSDVFTFEWTGKGFQAIHGGKTPLV